jgi:hypothetical protein
VARSKLTASRARARGPASIVTTAAGLFYGASSSHYSYGWQTDSSWAGTCRRFSLSLNDGTGPHTAVFEFFA